VNGFSDLSWHQVVEWAENEIARLRQRNDAVELDPTETAALRGEIRALKRLVALPKEAARKSQMALPARPAATDL